MSKSNVKNNRNGNGKNFLISKNKNLEMQRRPDGPAHLGHSTCLLTTPTRL